MHGRFTGTCIHGRFTGTCIHGRFTGNTQNWREMEGAYRRIAALRRRQVEVHTQSARGVADVYCFLKVLVLVTPPATNVQSIVFGSVISRVMSECTSAFWS